MKENKKDVYYVDYKDYNPGWFITLMCMLLGLLFFNGSAPYLAIKLLWFTFLGSGLFWGVNLHKEGNIIYKKKIEGGVTVSKKEYDSAIKRNKK